MTFKAKTVAAIVGLIVVTGVVLATRTHWPWVLAHHEKLRNLALVAAGAIAVPLAIWRAWVAERQAETARRSLLNERDQKAAEMLGSTLLSVRLGGIYALQTLAAEHLPHYHLGVMRQFCAFVRGSQNPTLTDASLPAGTAPEMPDSGARPDIQDNHARRGAAAGDAASESVREDVRAVMDAVAARSNAGVEVEQREKGFRLDLSGANLREWQFSEANLSKANLSEANLSLVMLSEANLCEANLCEANLSGADLPGANLCEANLVAANLSGADLPGADLSGADLYQANLSEADLVAAKLHKANFPEANLSRAMLCRADLSGANLLRADLSRADFSRADPSEEEANLSEANLSRADLSGADLSGANLSGANLSGANLSGANLSEANLSGANLSEANFFEARLSAGTLIAQEQLDKTVAVLVKTPPISSWGMRQLTP